VAVLAASADRPVYPPLQALDAPPRTAAVGQVQTLAVQQNDAGLFNDLVGNGEHAWQNGQAERLRGPEVDVGRAER
jgi:hypothetical protein